MPHPLHRNLHDLTTRTFDLLVIGGGIYGLTVAADAAQREVGRLQHEGDRAHANLTPRPPRCLRCRL